MKVTIRKDQEISNTLILKLIDNHKKEVTRLNRMYDYYMNKPSISRRQMKDPSKPNNKITNNYARYITSVATSHFCAVPIQTRSQNQQLLDHVEIINKYNDDIDVNTTLATNCSIYGYAYEMHYIDENSIQRYAAIDPRQVIYLTNDSLTDEPVAVIRYYDTEDFVTGEKVTYLEIHDKSVTLSYRILGNNFQLMDAVEHYYDDVPFVRYVNNNDERGDFEPVMDQIDAYDKAQSDTANDFEYFTDAYLLVSGAYIDKEQVESLKENRVFNFDTPDLKVEFITKEIQDTAVENYKTRLDNDIHKLSFIPNLSDENFGNASGQALKFKTQGLEFISKIKESKFKKGLLRRIELITNILNIKTTDRYSFTDVEFVFTRNSVDNLTELSTMITNLTGIISHETQLDMLPFVTDTEKEMEKISKEKEDTFTDSYDETFTDPTIEDTKE